jgi:23S rRNA (adenine2503-C2)-methyltransferase
MVLDGRGGSLGALEAYRRFYREGLAPPGETLGETLHVPGVMQTLREESAEGEVIKFLTRVQGVAGPAAEVSRELGELSVESVLIPMRGKRHGLTYTLCVSSQVGCAMGCTFCETGQMGLLRSLSTSEIVAQYWNAQHVLGVRPKNIVFMGMGEPLDNYENVVRAIEILKSHDGPHVPVSQITVSTVGRVDGIERLSEQVRTEGWHRLGIALSLNAPNDADRSAIMPINRRWNLSDVQRAFMAWPRYAGNKICVEYVLIPTVNDSERHAQEIADFMRPFGLLEGGRIGGQAPRAVLNLIPYNPRRNSPWPAPQEERVEEFLGWLIERGVFAKRRRTKGRQMMGACGQLGAAHIRKRRVVDLTVSGSSEGTHTSDGA